MKPKILTPEPTEHEIQHSAYLLWEQAGRPAGRDWEFWLTAKERLKHLAPVTTGARRGPAVHGGLSEKTVRAILAD
jgi:hypothetical protein